MAKIKGRLDFIHVSTGVFVPVLILAGIIFGYFVAWPQNAKNRENQALLNEKEAEVSDRESSLTAVRKLIDQVESNSETLATIDSAMPSSPAIPELLANLEFLTKQSGLLITDLDLETASVAQPASGQQPQENGTGLAELFVKVSVSGQYPQLFAFILNLEQNLRLFDVQNIEFKKESPHATVQAYTIRIKTYYQKSI